MSHSIGPNLTDFKPESDIPVGRCLCVQWEALLFYNHPIALDRSLFNNVYKHGYHSGFCVTKLKMWVLLMNLVKKKKSTRSYHMFFIYFTFFLTSVKYMYI